MFAIKQWAFSLCAAMIACGIARMLLPKSSMEKMFRMVVSVFFIGCMLSPFILRNPALIFDPPDETRREIAQLSRRLSAVADEQALRIAKQNLERMLHENLKEKGIKVHAVTININTSGQNISADIVLDRAHEARHENLVEGLRSEFGFAVRLGYREA